MKNYVILFLVGVVDGLVALACLSYAHYNLSAGWAFFLGVVYAQTVPHLTKRAADGFYCGCKNVVRVKGNPACSECHKPIRPPLTQTVRRLLASREAREHETITKLLP